MRTKFYLFLTASLYTSSLFATWGNPVIEPQEKTIVFGNEEKKIRVSLENDFGANRVVQAAIFDDQLKEWDQPINLSAADLDAKKYLVATDPTGNAVVMWHVSVQGLDLVQASVFSRETNAWSSIHDLSNLKTNLNLTHLGMDESGNVFASWTEKYSSHNIVWSRTYSKKLGVWSREGARKELGDDNEQVLLDTNANSLLVRNKKTAEAFIVPLEQAPLDLLEKALR